MGIYIGFSLSCNRWACIVDDSTLSTYYPQLLGLYTPKWRLRKSIHVERHRPARVIMCEALWACIVHEKALYINKNPLLSYLLSKDRQSFLRHVYLIINQVLIVIQYGKRDHKCTDSSLFIRLFLFSQFLYNYLSTITLQQNLHIHKYIWLKNGSIH